MKEINLGATDLTVSALCMGTVYFGSRVKDDEAFRMMDEFRDLGGNFLDTARVYADWLTDADRQASEKCIGRWRKSRRITDVFVATKGAHPPLSGGRPTLSGRELLQQCEESRRNLDLEQIPVYYLHRDDAELPISQIMDAVFTLQDRGMIAHAACSNWTAARIREAQSYAAANHREGFIGVSNQWSLAKPVPGAGDPTLVYTDRELAAFHRDTQLPLLPFTSMANGYLSKLAEGKPINRALEGQWGIPENAQIAEEAVGIAREMGISVAQTAQAFFYGQAFPVIPVMSFSSSAQLQEACAATEISLPESAIKQLSIHHDIGGDNT